MNYIKLNEMIYKENRKLYIELPFASNKWKTIKYLVQKIPDLPTSIIREVKSINNIKDLNNFVLKNSIGHSAKNVYILHKIKPNTYYEKIRNKLFNTLQLSDIIKKSKNPFIEKQIGKSLPYDIKVHIFFGKISFFYIYKKSNGKEKARYDSELKYINYEDMFYHDSFKNPSMKENKNLINNIKNIQSIFNYSLQIFNHLEPLVYCSIDWLYDNVSGNYSFCELTSTPFSLSKPIKEKFISDYNLIK
jgi:hypothetical protein